MSAFCSDACGLKWAADQIKPHLDSLKPVAQRSLDARAQEPPPAERTSAILRLVKLVVRALESRQLRIDDAVERMYRLNAEMALTAPAVRVPSKSRGDRGSSTRVCAFDSRIVHEWSVDLDPTTMRGKSLADVAFPPDPEPEVERELARDHDGATPGDAETPQTAADTPTSASAPAAEPHQSPHFRATMCLVRGRCFRHDGWEVSKTREVEIEIADQLALVRYLSLQLAELDTRLQFGKRLH
ncbi:hypothetical protein HK105_205327 [Polyrhizophydium stewartii]|uniref:Uncharacterized protein n=1 Tax=Polyrhizophydium stewartii TaxID=2732419 RepID=A0ABR4N6S6_9FUNG